MSTKNNRNYDRISRVRVLRGIIATLLLCIGLLTYAVSVTGRQIETLQAQVEQMSIMMMEATND